MCPPRVEAHPEVMFNDFETTKALVSDRQRTLTREAATFRLARAARKARRASADVRSHRDGAPTSLPPAVTDLPRHTQPPLAA